MESLYIYIEAMSSRHRVQGPQLSDYQIQDHSFTEEGTTVTCQQAMYHFANGVVIERHVETDHVETDHIETDGAETEEERCSECWISYQVTVLPEGIQIYPRRKTFTNACQESFWLKMNRLHHQGE